MLYFQDSKKAAYYKNLYNFDLYILYPLSPLKHFNSSGPARLVLFFLGLLFLDFCAFALYYSNALRITDTAAVMHTIHHFAKYDTHSGNFTSHLPLTNRLISFSKSIYNFFLILIFLLLNRHTLLTFITYNTLQIEFILSPPHILYLYKERMANDFSLPSVLFYCRKSTAKYFLPLHSKPPV